MRKLFESDFAGFDESSSQITIFECSEDEIKDIYEKSHRERCDFFDVFDERGYDVMPGALYHSYDFYIEGGFVVMVDTVAYNI